MKKLLKIILILLVIVGLTLSAFLIIRKALEP